jgi:transposase
MASAGLVGGQGRLVEVEPAAVVAAVEPGPAGEEKTFRPYDPDQVLLLAPVLSEWVPEGDLAHLVSDLVESGALDLSAIYADYEEERGYPPYDPRLMVKLLVYGYAIGVVSSRKLERATYRDLAVRMLCADQHPDYRSIARFRARHLEALGGLFVQALRLCRQAKLVGLGTLALDGTKLRANASRRKAMSYARMGRAEAQLEAEVAAIRTNVRALLEEAAAVDADEDAGYGPDRRGDELPAELQRREQRLAAIREAKQALEAEAAEREAQRRAELEAQDKKPRRPPNRRDPFQPKPGAQRNFTDPESRIMKNSDGAFHQCYNGQALVDSRAQVIVACELSNEAPDARQLESALDQLAENLDAIEAELPEGATLSADAGYFSEDNVRITVAHGLDPHIATGRFKHSEPQPPAPRGPIPKNATAKQRMARKLKTKKGRAVYSRRKTIVEPVFGQINTVQNGREMLLRGKQAAREQWRFHCAIHNLLKLHRAGGLNLIVERNSAPASPSTDSPARARPRGSTALAALEAVTHSLSAHCRSPLATTSADRFAQIAAYAVTDPRS